MQILILLLAAALFPQSAAAAPQPPVLRVMTHDSFSVSKGVAEQFEKAFQVKLQFLRAGDAGETLAKAILSKGNPPADVLFGVDNTFLGRALDADIFQPYASPRLSEIPEELRLDPQNRLVPVDFGFVCLNYDKQWFSSRSLTAPSSLEDLARPEYKGLLVVENPSTSSPGLAFLLATIGRFGETGSYTWKDYWKALRANDVLVAGGWSDAYYGEFSAAGKGKRPLVVSYATSPAATVYYASEPKPKEPQTDSILVPSASFRQIEFAGILRGAREPELAGRFIDFLLGREFQEDIPLQMFVYPSNRTAALPDLFTRFAPVPRAPAVMDGTRIEKGRDEWIREWIRIVLR
jgi:thiamine transport system substrate-binding protein